MPQYTYGDQKTTLWSQFFLPSITWVSEIELRPQVIDLCQAPLPAESLLAHQCNLVYKRIIM